MAIEKSGGYGGDAAPLPQDMHGDDESSEREMPAEDSDKTAEIPLSMVMDGQPGDVVRLKILSRNEDSGTATVKYADEPKMGSSIKEAAAQFEA